MTHSSRKLSFMILMTGAALLSGAHIGMAQAVAPTDQAQAPVAMGISSPAAQGVPAENVTPAAAAETADPKPATTSNAPTDPATGSPVVADPNAINPNDIPSVLFTYWEHTAIADAKNSVGQTRDVTDAELMRDLKTRETTKTKPPPEEREIKLSGIVYVRGDDWTIWLNGKRVTPKAIPKEVMDLKVYKEYIEMKWFDDYTNQIFPIRLRTHQRFNIDSRIFLPG